MSGEPSLNMFQPENPKSLLSLVFVSFMIHQ